jgi:hypothetical protein
MQIMYNKRMVNSFFGYLVYYAPAILMLVGGITWLNKLSADVKTAQADTKDLKERLEKVEKNWSEEIHHLRTEMNDQFNYQRQSLDKMYQFMIKTKDI